MRTAFALRRIHCRGMVGHAAHQLAVPVSCATVLMVCTSAIVAQVSWTEIPGLSSRTDAAIAFDEVRDRLVLFGGRDEGWADDTWEWDGTAWARRSPTNTPSARLGAVMIYDPVRRRVLLFGGMAGGPIPMNDTWAWDGTDWTRRTPTASPQARGHAASAFDTARGRWVVFGGYSGSAALSDTWEWDGSAWINRTVNGPAARSGHAMTFHAASGKTVLFGGEVGLNDTWEWDGTRWAQVFPATSPPARHFHSMVYDQARAVIVMCGGTTGIGTVADTWEWNGSNWVQRTSGGPPTNRAGHTVAYDSVRARVLLFGGGASDLWAWNGTSWTQVHAGFPPRPDGLPSSVAYDTRRSRLVQFVAGLGQTTSTWEWDDTGWQVRSPTISPPHLRGASLLYDSLRHRVLLFGGEDPGYRKSNDLWQWDGSNWSLVAATTRPPGRYLTSLAFDAARDRIVLFGGNIGVAASDTWEFDGTAWRQAAPPTAPPPRQRHAMAYDAARSRVVMFGGSDGTPVFADTWEWDGANWTQRFPATRPLPGGDAFATYDPDRRRVVMVMDGAPTTTWEWTGSDWMPRTTSSARPFGSLTYCDHRRGVLLGAAQTLWEYAPTRPADLVRFGAGCAGSAGTPSLAGAPHQWPWIGETCTLALSSLPASTAVALALGTSSTSWLGVPLPAALDFLGMRGCTLYTDVAVTLDVRAVGGAGAIALAIPNVTALVGRHFFAQAFVADPAANQFGITATNAVDGRFGAR